MGGRDEERIVNQSVREKWERQGGVSKKNEDRNEEKEKESLSE